MLGLYSCKCGFLLQVMIYASYTFFSNDGNFFSKQCKNSSEKSQFTSLMRKSVQPLNSHDFYNVQDKMAQSFCSVGTHLTLSPHSHYKWEKLLTWLKRSTASLKLIWLFSVRNSPSSQHKSITVTPFLKHWGRVTGFKLILLLSSFQS